jgi:type IV fimbrial biogenesis protein FimT
MRRRHLGFNLIELMLAIAVLSLILGYGVPSFVESIRNTQVRGLAESLQNGLQRARAEAIKRNRPVSFWLVTPPVGIPDASCALSSTSASWVVSLDNPAGRCEVAPSDGTTPRIVQVVGSTSGSINVAATNATGSAATSITFNPFGQPLASPAPIARIDLTHVETGVRRLSIQISSSGGVRMCDQDVASGDPRACLP